MHSPEALRPLQPTRRRSLALWLVRLAVRLNGGCPCEPCERGRRFDASVRRLGGRLPRAVRRQIHQDAWKVGRS